MTDSFSLHRWREETETAPSPEFDAPRSDAPPSDARPSDASVIHPYVAPKLPAKKEEKPITSAAEFWDRLGI